MAIVVALAAAVVAPSAADATELQARVAARFGTVLNALHSSGYDLRDP